MNKEWVTFDEIDYFYIDRKFERVIGKVSRLPIRSYTNKQNGQPEKGLECFVSYLFDAYTDWSQPTGMWLSLNAAKSYIQESCGVISKT